MGFLKKMLQWIYNNIFKINNEVVSQKKITQPPASPRLSQTVQPAAPQVNGSTSTPQSSPPASPRLSQTVQPAAPQVNGSTSKPQSSPPASPRSSQTVQPAAPQGDVPTSKLQSPPVEIKTKKQQRPKRKGTPAAPQVDVPTSKLQSPPVEIKTKKQKRPKRKGTPAAANPNAAEVKVDTARPNHYEMLGITQDASESEVRKEYYRESKQWHPDRNKSPEAQGQSQIKKINEAYEILRDPEKREIYDAYFTRKIPDILYEAYVDKRVTYKDLKKGLQQLLEKQELASSNSSYVFYGKNESQERHQPALFPDPS